MHSAGTTVGKTAFPSSSQVFSKTRFTEGSWDDVMRLIGQAHTLLHDKGIVRIQSDIRVGSRTDKAQTMEDKVSAVEKLLAGDKE